MWNGLWSVIEWLGRQLINIVLGVVDWIAGWVQWFIDLIATIWVAFWTVMYQLVLTAWYAFLELLMDFFCFLIDMVTVLINTIMIDLSSYQTAFYLTAEVFSIANVFIPISDITAMVMLYVGFCLVVWTIRFVIKMIPTIG